MDFKKFFESDKDSDKKKRLIVLAAAVIVIILIILLLLHSCDNNAGAGNGTGTPNTTATSTIGGGGGNGGNGNGGNGGNGNGGNGGFDPNAPVTGDITYDEELVSTWYFVEKAMVLNEGGTGDLYIGDYEGGQIQWYTVGNRLTLITAEKTSVATYVVDGDDLILTYSDGTTETWFR